MELVIATYNRGKFAELHDGLKPLGIPLLSLNDLRNIPEAPETGATFSQIAREKAQYYFDRYGADTSRQNGASPVSPGILAEDSGLLIPVRDGYPGIFSARIGNTDE